MGQFISCMVRNSSAWFKLKFASFIVVVLQLSPSAFLGNARKKDKYKRMKQQEVKKELKMKGGGKVTPVNGMNYFGSIFWIACNFMLHTSMVILIPKIKTQLLGHFLPNLVVLSFFAILYVIMAVFGNSKDESIKSWRQSYSG